VSSKLFPALRSLMCSFSDLYRQNPNLSTDAAMIREGGSMEQLRIARAEFDQFVQATYDALLVHLHPTPLHFMCRMDISVMMNPTTQRLDYFVNEVEQSPTLSIFGILGDGLYMAHRFGDETKGVLLRWLDNHCRQS